MSRAALAALALIALALSGCESTQEKSARLEAAAKREKAEHPELAQHGLSIAHPSSQVRVQAATVVQSSEGAAAAVTVTNTSAHTVIGAPIAITVRDARGRIVYQNNTAGLESALTEIPSIPAHGTLTWIDDQVSTSGGASGSPTGGSATGGSAGSESATGGSASGGSANTAASTGAGAGGPLTASAIVGEAPAAGGGSGPEPHIEVQGAHLAEASTGETSGTVHNASTVAQRQLIVYVTARHGSAIVAAGRAELPEVAAGASVPFHAFLIGSASGARIEADAPPSTFG